MIPAATVYDREETLRRIQCTVYLMKLVWLKSVRAQRQEATLCQYENIFARQYPIINISDNNYYSTLLFKVYE